MKSIAAAVALAAAASAMSLPKLATRDDIPNIDIRELGIKCNGVAYPTCYYTFGLVDDPNAPINIPDTCAAYESTPDGQVVNVEDGECTGGVWSWSANRDASSGDVLLTFTRSDGVCFCHKLPGDDFVEQDGYQSYVGPKYFQGSVKDCN